jgi:hypothetical protein
MKRLLLSLCLVSAVFPGHNRLALEAPLGPPTSAEHENDSSGSGEQKKACDAKWDTYKGRSGAHGWHDYFQFMAKCM